MANLIDSLKQQGWDFLIPIHLEKAPNGEYVTPEAIDELSEELPYGRYNYNRDVAEKFGVYEPEVWDPEYQSWDEDFYIAGLDTAFNEEDEPDVEDESENVEDSYYDRPYTLYDLKFVLDCDSLTDEEFLSMTAKELLGITNGQLKFVDQRAVQNAGIGHYKDMLKKKETEIPSVEQRIKYVNVMSLLSFGEEYRPPIIHVGEENEEEKYYEYIKNIIFKHETNEAVQLIDWYIDYLRMYEKALITNEEHKQNGETYFDYEVYPKPSHIKDLHDKASRDYTEYMAKEAEKHKKTTDLMISDFIESDIYKKYLYTGEKYSVIAVTSCDDLIKEGENLKHCIANYINDFALGRSYLYFIRENSNLKRSLYSVELLEKSSTKYVNHGKKMYINQCYGYQDTIDKSEELREFILEWARIKQLTIDCPF